MRRRPCVAQRIGATPPSLILNHPQTSAPRGRPPPPGSPATGAPRRGWGAPPGGGYLFVVVALVRVDAAFEVKSAMEFLAGAVGEACGEEAAVEDEWSR